MAAKRLTIEELIESLEGLVRVGAVRAHDTILFATHEDDEWRVFSVPEGYDMDKGFAGEDGVTVGPGLPEYNAMIIVGTRTPGLT